MTENNQQPNGKKNAIQLVGSSKDLVASLSSPQFKEMVKAVAGKYMPEERIVKIALLARTRNNGLAKCSLPSFLQSAIKAAELGLDFAGQTGQAYLVPLKNKWTGHIEANFWPGYQGFIELAYRSGKIDYIHAQLVHEKDKFEYGLGTQPFINHTPSLGENPGRLLCGYAVAFIKNSKYPLVEVMSDSKLEAVGERSKAKDSGPWKTDRDEMKRKTLVRRIWKYLPKTPEMVEAEQADNRQFEMTGDFIDDTTQDIEMGVNGLKKRIDAKEIPSTEPPVNNNKRHRRTKPEIEADNKIKDITAQASKEEEEAARKVDIRPKYICHACGQLVIEPNWTDKGRVKCPLCETEGDVVEATEKDYADAAKDAQ